jgi:hypothetical protein
LSSAVAFVQSRKFAVIGQPVEAMVDSIGPFKAASTNEQSGEQE